MIVEVEDLSDTKNPSSLLVQVFEGEIAESRSSEWRDSIVDDGVFSVALSSQDMKAGLWFITVSGTSYTSVRYRVLVVPIPTTLTVGRSLHGEM